MNIAAQMIEPHEYGMIDLIRNFLWLGLFSFDLFSARTPALTLVILSPRRNSL